MEIETLVATIDQTDHSLPARMNLQGDAIIANQCGHISAERFAWEGQNITYLNTAERGVGRNRNLLLKHMRAEIGIFADDDMRFVDGYPEIARKAFAACEEADILIFNLLEKKPERYVHRTMHRVRFYNYAKYGAARIAFRRKNLLEKNIRFSLLFGGGAKYSCGEDTIFLAQCLKAGLKIYTAPYSLAEIDQEVASTWFSGYHEKFFRDKGVLYAHLHPVAWPLYSLRFLFRRRGKGFSFARAYGWMLAGAVGYRRAQDREEDSCEI